MDFHLQVDRADGSRRHLKAEGRLHGPSGWADAGKVVPIDQAIAFFSDRIEADPQDAFARIMRAIALNESDEDEQPGEPPPDLPK